jgi:phosphatidylglycerol:prolipoprotein diacylglycerol transferase
VIDWTPSPIALQVGPLGIPWYGIGYAVAIGFGTWLTGVQARRRGLETGFIGDALILVIVCGIIGARLYHVIDQWPLYRDNLLKIVLPPYSGLALYGGVGGGIVGVYIATRSRHQSFVRWADVVVPSLFFGQAIGRWGNFFNQELYGPPTNLPWGIAIDCAHRVAAYLCPGDPRLLPGAASFPLASTGFHPLFFYEASLTFTGGLLTLWASRRFAGWLRDGDLLSFWFVWYGAIRAALETFRSTDSQGAISIQVVIGFGAVVVVLGIASIVWRHRGPRREEVASGGPPRTEPAPPDAATALPAPAVLATADAEAPGLETPPPGLEAPPPG